MAELPFSTFILLMQPIHLAIGIVEGVVTSTVVIFVWKARPEILQYAQNVHPLKDVGIRNVVAGLLVAAVVTGGAISWFASTNPDGLEWAILGITGSEKLNEPEHGIHKNLANLQEKAAVLPDYGFKNTGESYEEGGAVEAASDQWPNVDTGTTASGLVGGFITLIIAGCIGLLLKRRNTSS